MSRAASGELQVGVAYAYQDFFDDFIGAFLGSLALDKLLEPISRVRVGDSGYVVVVDQRGTIIAHPDVGRILTVPALVDGASLPAEADERSAILDRANITGTDDIVAYAHLASVPWSLLVVLPHEEFLSPVRDLLKTLAAIALVVLLAGTLLAWAFAGHITRPLAKLTQASTSLAGGDLSARVDVGSSDEVGSLAKSFNAMAEQIEKNSLEIKQEIEVRQRAERALRQNEERVRRIFEAASEGICGVDRDGLCTFANPAFADLLGYRESGRATGKRIGDLICVCTEDDGRDLLRDRMVLDALRNGENLYIECASICRADRKLFQAEIRSSPIRSEGKVLGAVITVNDVSERVMLEEQLRQSQKMEAVGQLTGGVAHDFNNLLAVIVGNLELLEDRVADKPEMMDLLSRAIAASNRGASLTRDLLAFSRRQTLLPASVNLGQLVSAMRDLLQRSLGETIEVETRIAPGLWNCYIDSGQMQNAIINLALNARDAMPEGGRLVIETKNSGVDPIDAATDLTPGEYVMLSVSDNGYGIEADMLDRVFEPFFTTKDLHKGTGLGLSMVFGFVKQSGGDIRIESEKQRGTTVRLFLPRAEQHREAGDESRPDAARGDDARGEMLLVVEDDTDVRDFVVTMLGGLGYRVLQAGSANEALALLDQHTGAIDLLITDMVLPGPMNGRQLSDEVARRCDGMKALFMSGYPANSLVDHDGGEQGPPMIQKPFRKAEFSAMVRRILDAPPAREPKESGPGATTRESHGRG